MNESPETPESPKQQLAKAKLAGRVKLLEIEVLKLRALVEAYRGDGLRRHASENGWMLVALTLILLFAVVYGVFLLHLQLRRNA